LIDYWRDIEFLKGERIKVTFLKAFKLLKGNPKIIEHLFEGVIYSDGNIGGIHSIIAQSNGCVVNPVTIPGPSGTYKAHVGKYNSNNILIMKLDRKGNLLDNDMFPDIWNESQLLEELTYAFENMRYFEGNQWIGILRNGSTCTFCMKGLKKDKIITLNTRVITVWPN